MEFTNIAVGTRNTMCDAPVDAIDVGGAGKRETHADGFGVSATERNMVPER